MAAKTQRLLEEKKRTRRNDVFFLLFLPCNGRMEEEEDGRTRTNERTNGFGRQRKGKGRGHFLLAHHHHDRTNDVSYTIEKGGDDVIVMKILTIKSVLSVVRPFYCFLV